MIICYIVPPHLCLLEKNRTDIALPDVGPPMAAASPAPPVIPQLFSTSPALRGHRRQVTSPIPSPCKNADAINDRQWHAQDSGQDFFCGHSRSPTNAAVFNSVLWGAVEDLPPLADYPGGTSAQFLSTLSSRHRVPRRGDRRTGTGLVGRQPGRHLAQAFISITSTDPSSGCGFYGAANTPMKHINDPGGIRAMLIENMASTNPAVLNTDGINREAPAPSSTQLHHQRGRRQHRPGPQFRLPEPDILITNITCGTGHGISIGSITKAGESNITVVNCSFTGTEFGLRLKADNDRGGVVQNITCHDIAASQLTRRQPIVVCKLLQRGGFACHRREPRPRRYLLPRAMSCRSPPQLRLAVT